MKPRIAITLGDPAGIGPEIVSAAIQSPDVLEACHPVVVGDPLAFALHHQPLPKVEMLSTPGLNKKLPLGTPTKAGGLSAVEALYKAIALVQGNQVQALVTAPVSKEAFHRAGTAAPGHTEFLAREAGATRVEMLMVAGALRALLLTRHVPLMEVTSHLSSEGVVEAALLGHAFMREKLKIAKPRLVACGLNPHAGDGGLFGQEEKEILTPALQLLRRRGIAVKGPWGADSVFRDMKTGRFDLALAAYHDQAMIALKVFAPDLLVNVTIGLPFIRTSPGHGTAYDIAGKGKANPRPMIEAILLAVRYSG